MNIMNSLFNSVTDFYNTINPNTLSGASDIIVVKIDNKLICTPFYVRFGTLQMFRITMKTVYLIVNGNMTDIYMKIGKNGNLYFEFEEEEIYEGVEVYEDHYNFDIEFKENQLEEFGYVSDSELNGFLKKNLMKKIDNRKEIKKNESIENEKNKDENEKNKDENKKEIINNENKKEIINNENKKDRYTQQEYDLLRSQNYEKRTFMKVNLSFETNFYSKKYSYTTFKRFLNSIEHLEFIFKNFKIFQNLLLSHFESKKCKKQKKNFKGCKNIEIRYSKSLNEDLIDTPESIFQSFVVREFTSFSNLVVEIKSCEFCGIKFLLPFNFFSESLFFLKNILNQKNQKIKFAQFLENRFHLKGWFKMTDFQQFQKKSLILNSDQLKLLNLKDGKNTVVFKVGGIDQQIEANIYLWDQNSKIIISDIDGTITKSDILGHLYDMVGLDYTHCGIARLFRSIEKNGYKFLYLSSRSMSQYLRTERYLKNVNQNGYSMPDGPIMLSPDGIFSALYREVVSRRPELFKISCLDSISQLFPQNPFVAGFGNRINDVISYKSLKIPISKIFTVNHNGEVNLELKRTLVSSYLDLNVFVNSIFPVTDGSVDEFYNEFKYWSL